MDLEEPEEEENIAEEVWAKEEEECLRPREGMLECLKIVSVLNVVELSPIRWERRVFRPPAPTVAHP